MTRLVLVHGVVTGPSAWDPLLPFLEPYDLVVPERPRTGSLDEELSWLASVAQGAWVVGVSGGATLGLALAATGVPLAGAVLHEPAVGSLAPGLLAPVAAAFESWGVVGLGSTLYGASWSLDLCPPAAFTTAPAELAMFRGFEPSPVSPAAGKVVVTHGGASPPARWTAARALLPLGCSVRRVPRATHFAPHDHPDDFARVLRAVVGDLSPQDEE